MHHAASLFGEGPAGEGGERGGVQPARKQGAHGHVGHQLSFHRVLEQVAYLFRGGGQVIGMRPAFQLPVPAEAHTVLVEHQTVTGAQFRNPTKDAVSRCAGRTEHENLGQPLRVHLRLHRRVGQECLRFRTEQKGRTAPGVKQGFDAHPVAGHEQALVVCTPHGEGEDTVQAFQALRTPFHEGQEQRLGVGVAAEDVTPRFQFPPQLGRVIQLTIIDQNVFPLSQAADHGLTPARGVYHDQAPVSQGGACGEPDAGGIRSPGGQSLGHFGDRRAFPAQVTLPVDPTCDAAHVSLSPFPRTRESATTSSSALNSLLVAPLP